MTSPSILVVGGGIGGLTTAIALRKVGLSVRVVEQSAALGDVGAGITIQCNGSAVFDALGIDFRDEDVVSIGHVKVVNAADRVLMEANSDELGLPFPSINIHRADLQATLVRALEAAGGTLELGRKVMVIRPQSDGVDVIFEDGEALRVDLLLAADGINSTVRRALLGSTGSRYSGQTCWRFAESVTSKVPIITTERWAPGKRAGLVPLSRGRVYGYLVRSAPAGTASATTTSVGHIRSVFGGMHAGLDEIFAQLQAREDGETISIHHADLRDQPHISYGKGRVVLLGDAAHAMTPNMGQGANQAIEDAAAIAIALGSGGVELERLADHLDGTRRDRVTGIQKTSWRIGSVAHWQNPFAAGVRDLGMSLLPKSASARQAVKTYEPGLELAQTLRDIVEMRS